MGLLVRCSPLFSISLVALLTSGLACSVKVGSGPGKPAGADAAAPSSSGRPVAASSPGKPQPTPEPEPEPDPEPDPEPAPAPAAERERPRRVADPGGAADPTRAVCRADDDALASLCHRALDPIAAGDAESFLASLEEGAKLVRPGPDGRKQTLDGPAEIKRAMHKAGGLSKLVRVSSDGRVVGTIVRDCRRCARSFVTIEANTRAGRMLVTMLPSSPPRIEQIELSSVPRTSVPGRERAR